MNRLIAEVEVGTRTKLGTDWPVVDQLRQTGTRQWTVVRELCNGVPRSSEEFTSETAAREAFERRLTGPKPRAGETAEVRFEIRLTTAERDAWKALADKEELSLSELVREAVGIAVARGSVR